MENPKDRAGAGGGAGFPQHAQEEQPILRISSVDEDDSELCDPSRTIPTDSEGQESL